MSKAVHLSLCLSVLSIPRQNTHTRTSGTYNPHFTLCVCARQCPLPYVSSGRHCYNKQGGLETGREHKKKA